MIFGLRELPSCSNTSISDERAQFSSNYELRLFTSACYYLNDQNEWQSDGLTVGPATNHYETQCFSRHLTRFASGFSILPEPVNWKKVFANGDFLKNKTIYLTVIVVALIYLLLLTYARFFDGKDLEKVKIDRRLFIERTLLLLLVGSDAVARQSSRGSLFLSDSRLHRSSQRFRNEIESKSFARLSCRRCRSSRFNFFSPAMKTKHEFEPSLILNDRSSPAEVSIRFFSRFRSQFTVDVHLFSRLFSSRTLGSLNYLHFWHDNSGAGRSSSWFVKYFIVRDLQTLRKDHFLCQRWLAVEKDDGKVSSPVDVLLGDDDSFFIVLDRTIVTGGQWTGERTFLLRFRETNSTSTVRWTSLVFDLLSSILFSVHSCPTMYLLFRLTLSLDVSEHHVLRSLQSIFQSLHSDLRFLQHLLSTGSFVFLLHRCFFFETWLKIVTGIIVELLALLPSLLVVQLFRRLRSTTTKVKGSWTLPSWCLYPTYGLCLILVGTSIAFILARGIEFGDVKSQQWLTSTVSGFFSSILLTQPMKVRQERCIQQYELTFRDQTKVLGSS